MSTLFASCIAPAIFDERALMYFSAWVDATTVENLSRDVLEEIVAKGKSYHSNYPANVESFTCNRCARRRSERSVERGSERTASNSETIALQPQDTLLELEEGRRSRERTENKDTEQITQTVADSDPAKASAEKVFNQCKRVTEYLIAAM